MFLTSSNIVHYLIARGAVHADSIVAGDFKVVEAGRRNRNFKIICERAVSLFVKQVRTNAPDSIATLNREAAFYDLVRRPAFARLAPLVPRLVAHDARTNALIVELLPRSQNLTEYHAERDDYPADLAGMLGAALATCHEQSSDILRDPATYQTFPRQMPWLLTLDANTLAPLQTLGPAGEKTMALLAARPILRQRIAALRSEWHYAELIHGDLKWDNLVVTDSAGGERALLIVDWELADLGCSSWDVAGVISAYLSAPLLNFESSGVIPQDLERQAAARLSKLRVALSSFFRSYAATRKLSGVMAQAYLLQCLRFTAARLALTVFEYLYTVPWGSPALLSLLDASESIFVDPGRAASELFTA